MFIKKMKIIVIFCLLFLIGTVAVVQAAPPLQGPSGSTEGHNLDLTKRGHKFGTVMSNRQNEATDRLVDSTGQNPVALALADFFDEASYEEIMALHESGFGFGNIAKAYFFITKFNLGLSAADLLAEGTQSGWGNLLKEHGIHPGTVGKGNRPAALNDEVRPGNGKGLGKDLNNKGQNNGKWMDLHNANQNEDNALNSDDDDDDGDGKRKGQDGKGKGKGNNKQGFDNDDN